MESEHRPDEEEDEDESATSVAHVPEALLQSLRHPDRAPVTTRPPALDPSPTEGDEDDSSTLVSADARKVPMHRAGPPVPRIPPPPAAPRPATKSQIDRFEAETEGSPDEDPSDTAMAARIPQAVMRHLSQRPPPPPAAPMFEPPPPGMFEPPPPEPLPAIARAPAPVVKSGSRVWIALVIAAVVLALMAAAGGAFVYFFVLRR